MTLDEQEEPKQRNRKTYTELILDLIRVCTAVLGKEGAIQYANVYGVGVFHIVNRIQDPKSQRWSRAGRPS
jgi:hypothetical protein